MHSFVVCTIPTKGNKNTAFSRLSVSHVYSKHPSIHPHIADNYHHHRSARREKPKLTLQMGFFGSGYQWMNERRLSGWRMKIWVAFGFVISTVEWGQWVEKLLLPIFIPINKTTKRGGVVLFKSVFMRTTSGDKFTICSIDGSHSRRAILINHHVPPHTLLYDFLSLAWNGIKEAASAFHSVASLLFINCSFTNWTEKWYRDNLVLVKAFVALTTIFKV